jgi:hypothetical protein
MKNEEVLEAEVHIPLVYFSKTTLQQTYGVIAEDFDY